MIYKFTVYANNADEMRKAARAECERFFAGWFNIQDIKIRPVDIVDGVRPERYRGDVAAND